MWWTLALTDRAERAGLNLPSKDKMVEPAFAMHWAESIPTVRSEDGLSEVEQQYCILVSTCCSDLPLSEWGCALFSLQLVVWAGSYGGLAALPPPPHSCASQTQNDVAIYFISLQPNGRLILPAAEGGCATNRVAYFVEGQRLNINGATVLCLMSVFRLDVDVPDSISAIWDDRICNMFAHWEHYSLCFLQWIIEESYQKHCALTLRAEMSATFFNPSETMVDVLILQGDSVTFFYLVTWLSISVVLWYLVCLLFFSGVLCRKAYWRARCPARWVFLGELCRSTTHSLLKVYNWLNSLRSLYFRPICDEYWARNWTGQLYSQPALFCVALAAAVFNHCPQTSVDWCCANIRHSLITGEHNLEDGHGKQWSAWARVGVMCSGLFLLLLCCRPVDAHVFPRDKGRFALQKGELTHPPDLEKK